MHLRAIPFSPGSSAPLAAPSPTQGAKGRDRAEGGRAGRERGQGERGRRERAGAQRGGSRVKSPRGLFTLSPVFGAGQPSPCPGTPTGPLSSAFSKGRTADEDRSLPWRGNSLQRSKHSPSPSCCSQWGPPEGRPRRRRAQCSAMAAAPVTSAAGVEVTSAGKGPVYLGYDFGTSGARVVAIDAAGTELFDAKQPYQEGGGGGGSVEEWREALFSLLASVPSELRGRAAGISLDGTSSTALIACRETGRPVSRPMMYNESFGDALPAVKAIAPPNHTVTTGTSTLCKLVSWWQHNVTSDGTIAPQGPGPRQAPEGGEVPGEPELREALESVAGQRAAEAVVLCHQADWLLAQLLGWGRALGGAPVATDYNNALKLGYDPGEEAYPSWMAHRDYAPLLPPVVAPGATLGAVRGAVAEQWGLPAACRVLGGTTDSIAAFLAAQVACPGEAVTSLGSTLAVKLLSTARVDDARYGVYSHRMGDTWLVGGASNTGGAVLRHFFSDAELRALSATIDPSSRSDLDYYPLLRPGERFPVADAALEPRLSPRPESDAAFLHGILESMAKIEARGYKLLQDLGASPLTLVSTAGGGAQNAVWTKIRERVIGVPVVASANTDAAFGAALLARDGCKGDVPLSGVDATLSC